MGDRIIWYKVKPLREAKGMSFDILQEKSGVNRVLLGRIENNSLRSIPEYHVIMAIAGVLGCGVLDLVTFFPEKDLNRVMVAREKRGLNKKDFCILAGISLNTLRKIEVLNQVPGRQVRRLVSKALDKPERELWPEERYGDQ